VICNLPIDYKAGKHLTGDKFHPVPERYRIITDVKHLAAIPKEAWRKHPLPGGSN
jgi:hypothetical protein